AFAASLKAARGEKSQGEFSEFLGVSQQTYSRYERGQIPDGDVLFQMAAKIGMSMEELLIGKRVETALHEDRPRFGIDWKDRAETAEKLLKDLRGDLVAILGKIDAIPAISSTLTAKEVGDHFVRGMNDE